jgi:subtilisin family serine protease
MNATQKFILPDNETRPETAGFRVLHRYPNGQVLVEAINEGETPEGAEEVRTGIQLTAGAESTASDADPLTNLPDNADILAYIEIIGPTDNDWLKQLRQEGLNVLRFHPQNAYLCSGTVHQFRTARQFYFVQNIRLISHDLKTVGELPESGLSPVWILFTGGQEVRQLAEQIFTNIEGVELDNTKIPEAVDYYLRFRANVSAEGQEALLHLPQVVGVESAHDAISEDEVANLILAGQYSPSGIPQGDYLRWLQDRNLNGKDVTIAIVDDGVDITHEAFAGRIKDMAAGAKSWHGTFVAGHAAGDYRAESDADGMIYGIGVAPKADILALSKNNITNSPSTQCDQTVNTSGKSSRKPGYIQNNSWGAGTKNPMDYQSIEAAYDRLVRNAATDGEAKPLTICFSAGNSGKSGLTRPKAAKNIIVTGNSENHRPKVGKNFADNIDHVYQNNNWQPSSHGNCGDGRVRPHLVAPGEWTAAANFSMAPGHVEYISPKLTWGGGTSGASPKTAGACALLVQWWRQNNAGQTPSPAMLRALLVNGAEPMKNEVSVPPVPSKVQGWGRLNLSNIFDESVHKAYLDQTVVLKNFGDNWSQRFRVSDPSRPVKITLAWTDPPGNPGTGTSVDNPAIVNRLNLRVEANNKVFHGNNFEAGWSKAGNFADTRLKGIDNLQNVFLKNSPVGDTFTLTVEALNVTTNCFDFSNLDPQQDFVIVVHNAHPDHNFTPADLFIVLDENFDNDTDDILDNQNNHDNQSDDDDDNWWDNIIDWWKDDDKEESKPQNLPSNWNQEHVEIIPETLSTPIDPKSLLPDLAAGIRLATAVQDKSQGSPLGETVVSSGTEKLTPLKIAIQHLLTQWSQSDGKAPKRSVIVIGKGTRTDKETIDGLRLLSFQGQLWLISDDSTALCRLAQSIHRYSGIQFRLAPEREALGAQIRWAFAEAAGAVQARVQEAPVLLNNNGQAAHLYSINLVDTDVKGTFYIRFGQITPTHLALKAPGNQRKIFDLLAFNDNKSSKGIDVQRGEDWLQVTITCQELTGIPTAGPWEILSDQTFQTIDAAVWDAQTLTVRVNELPDNADASNIDKMFLLTAGASNGLLLSQATVLPRVICQNKPATGTQESDMRPVALMPLVRVSPNGSSTSAEPESVATKHLADNISEWFTYEPCPDGSTLLDITVWLEGQDAKGNPFQRALRLNKTDLLSRSEAALQRRHREQFFPARIVKIYLRRGNVYGVRLQNGKQEFDCRVSSPVLARLLKRIDPTENQLHFGILDSELTRIFFLNKPG